MFSRSLSHVHSEAANAEADKMVLSLWKTVAVQLSDDDWLFFF